MELQNKLKLSSTTHNNGGTLYLINGLVYKQFPESIYFESELTRNIEYLIKNPIPNTPTIYKAFYKNKKIQGYIMEYKPNTMTFRQAIGKNINPALKIKAIKDIYQALKEVHKKNILLGDIHSDNFLIDEEGNGTIVDLDYIRFPGDEFKFFTCYLIKPGENKNKINISSPYTDNIKTMISSLSLLLEEDLENQMDKKDYSLDLEKLQEHIEEPKIKNYLTSTTEENWEYFDDFIEPKQKTVKSLGSIYTKL